MTRKPDPAPDPFADFSPGWTVFDGVKPILKIGIDFGRDQTEDPEPDQSEDPEPVQVMRHRLQGMAWDLEIAQITLEKNRAEVRALEGFLRLEREKHAALAARIAGQEAAGMATRAPAPSDREGW
jgi:hypothetical protein